METVAFNSREGDFFGLSAMEREEEEEGSDGIFYRVHLRAWDLVAKISRYWALLRRKSSATTANPSSGGVLSSSLPPPPISNDDDPLPPRSLSPGTGAMYGLSHRAKRKRVLKGRPTLRLYEATGRIDDGDDGDDGAAGSSAKGLFPCLEASMLVPGAAGRPLRLIRSRNRRYSEETETERADDFDDPEKKSRRQQTAMRPKKRRPGAAALQPASELAHHCCDAFCYEPIPYRSAVEKAGATHVLALRSRPDGCVVETRQHTYERIVGPIYFRKHGLNGVARLFRSGGSQFRYVEDVLTLDEGLARGISSAAAGRGGINNGGYDDLSPEGGEGRLRSSEEEGEDRGVLIPPTRILYGTDDDDAIAPDVENWSRAHLLPITVPYGTPELPTLSQDRGEILRALRHGYATAFDALAPVAGLPFDARTMPGHRVAELLFPDPVGDDDVDAAILGTRVKVKPSYIRGGGGVDEDTKRRSFAAWITGKREARRVAQREIDAHPDGAFARMVQRRASAYHESDQYVRDREDTLEWLEIEALLAALPGFRGGRLDHILDGLLTTVSEKKGEEK